MGLLSLGGVRMGVSQQGPGQLSSAPLFAWYDFSTLTGANGSSIANIPDLSGNGFTASSPGGHQPTITTNWNSSGLRAATSTASQYLQTAAAISSYAATSGITVAFVGQFTNETTTIAWFALDASNGTQSFVSATNTFHWNTNSDTSVTSTGVGSPCEVHGYFSQTGAQPTQNQVFVNNTSVINSTSASNNTGNTLNQITILNDAALTIGGCTLGEFLVWNGLLSSSDLAAVRTYLKNKWGTP